jgi:hypothetical protein
MGVDEPVRSALELCWLPLGAGGNFVRFNGRVYEAIQAYRARRPRCVLFHTALKVRLPEGSFVIETAWPIPDGDGASRGVAAEGPVLTTWIARFRVFRYEVRRWKNGTIADIGEAVEIQSISDDRDRARRVLDLVDSVPPLTWGRDELGLGEMWNSNSVISWLLASCGLPMEAIRPPSGGRAPGWDEGIAASRLHP